MNIKRLGVLVVLALLLVQCQEKPNTDFLISEAQVGKLQRTAVIDDINTLFAKDSVVQDTTAYRLGAQVKKINIYEKGGKHLLTVTPSTDSIPEVETIQVFDARYRTLEGVGLQSTFKDIKEHYTIKKIITSLNNIVIFPKDSDIYFTIDKEELPGGLRYSSTNVEAVQIPDAAKIKYLMVGWE